MDWLLFSPKVECRTRGAVSSLYSIMRVRTFGCKHCAGNGSTNVMPPGKISQHAFSSATCVTLECYPVVAIPCVVRFASIPGEGRIQTQLPFDSQECGRRRSRRKFCGYVRVSEMGYPHPQHPQTANLSQIQRVPLKGEASASTMNSHPPRGRS